MRIPVLLTTTLISWAIYDVGLLRQRRESYALTATEIALSEQEQQLKKIQREKGNVIPQWHRDFQKPVPLKVNYFSTKPRDVRFSNQRKIRRMFNNM